MKAKPIVLLIEDSDRRAEDALEVFDKKVQVMRARNVEEAREIFDSYGLSIDGIYFDACIEGHDGTEDEYTFEFATYVKSAGFRGPMVTASSDEEFNETLMEAGCDMRSTKLEAPTVLLRELGVLWGGTCVQP